MPRLCVLGSFWLVLLACGGSEPTEREPELEATEATASPSTPRTDGRSALQLTLAGEASQLEGGARLEVREESPIANLVVTAAYESNHDNLVQFQLALMGVENAMGYHPTELGPPGNSAASAMAYIDRQSYSSSAGRLEVTLAADGRITGKLEADLRKDSVPGELDESGEQLHLSGTFEGVWSLLCRSPVPALPGDHSVADSGYCNGLKF